MDVVHFQSSIYRKTKRPPFSNDNRAPIQKAVLLNVCGLPFDDDESGLPVDAARGGFLTKGQMLIELLDK